MTTYYEVLRPVTPADLYTRSRFVEILKLIPPQGRVAFETFNHIGRHRASQGIAHACSRGILKRISPDEQVLKFNSVQTWHKSLNKSGHKNSTSKHGTKSLYLRALSKFDAWLPGRPFQSHETVVNGRQITRQAVTKSFANVEEMMHYCMESDHGNKTAQGAIREYLTDLYEDETSASACSITRSAIKSYFNYNDVVLNLPGNRKKRADSTPDEDSYMTLEDIYRMVQDGKLSIIMKTVMLIQFQSGMDVSTLTDRFNYKGYSQIVKYFKTDNHKSWNLEMCPVPIKLGRVKRGVRYTTFLDRDAIAQLQRYLTWKEDNYGKQDQSKPLFMTKQNTPIREKWVSDVFSKVAARTGIQEKISPKMYKIRAHKVRHLLKSTLLTSGCKPYAADHVLGHAPRDSYEKQSTLYPEELRAEYAKASSRLNIFSKVESTLNTADDPESLQAHIKEMEAQAAGTNTTNAEIALLERRHRESMQKMYSAIESLNEKINSLQQQHDTVKDD